MIRRLLSRIARWLVGEVAEEVKDQPAVDLLKQALSPGEEEVPMPLTKKSVDHIQGQIASATSPRAITERHCIPPQRPPRKAK